jgi:uncharacterized RmlC-like cupin family protein
MQEISFDVTYDETDQGIWVLRLADLPLPKNFPEKPSHYVISFGPGAWGGNHRHERVEAFVGMGEGLYIVWQDGAGERHEQPMMSKDKSRLKMFVVPAWTPHMVENRSETETGILYEVRDIDAGELKPLEGPDSLR